MHRIVAVLLTVWAFSATAVLGQAPDDPGASPHDDAAVPDLALDLFALGGVTADPERLHPAGGPVLRVGYRGWGLLGLGTVGSGADYNSRLLAGALSRRLVRWSRLDVSAFAGYGAYSEKGPTGISRDAGGLLYGGMVTFRSGRFPLVLLVSDLVGSYDEADVTAPFGFHVPRLSIGAGISLR